jgi:hypothetical protein
MEHTLTLNKTVEGLEGLTFGAQIIKQTMKELAREFSE